MKMRGILATALVFVLAVSFAASDAQGEIACGREVTADVVVIDQPVLFNRLGASNVNGMIYALRRDVVNKVTEVPLTVDPAGAVPGQVMLRPDKRPRPLVLRVREGDCLTVNLENLLAPAPNPNQFPIPPQFTVVIDEQVADRYVSFHAAGMQYRRGPNQDDGAYVGANGTNSTIPPGASTDYQLYAEHEGVYAVSSYGATTGSDGNEGTTSNLLFGQVIVEPKDSRIYRSGVTEEEMRLASMNLDTTSPTTCGNRNLTADEHPIIDYEARYPAANCPDIVNPDGTVTPGADLGAAVWALEGKAGLPILNMINPADNQIVHSVLEAIVAGPGTDGSWRAATGGTCPGPDCPYPLESVGLRNPSVPNRVEAFRDFASVFHDESAAAQAFPGFYVTDPVFRYVLAGVKDAFMINYGSGGIGSEIIANRLRVGPMHDCLTCAFEEFFLTSFTVGDPAMLVDVSANTGLEALLPGQVPDPDTQGPKANYIPYPDDVANVHHSYTGDFTKIRNTHSGKEQHVFHLHNHQWLYNPNDDNSNYLDAQGIGPGVAYTYEINFGGSGNRMKSAGDSIFHCHFYPHFAQGMWYHWRHHDVFEFGTILAASLTPTGFHTARWGLENGTPMLAATAGLTPVAPGARVRAIPDGEVAVGAPIAALVPLPGKAMAPLPGEVQVIPNPLTTLAGLGNAAGAGAIVPVGSLARVVQRDVNPGYPFWIAGIEDTVGQRPPTPPLDMADAGLVGTLNASTDDDVVVKNAGGAVVTTVTDLFEDLMAAQADGWNGGLPRASLAGYAAGGTTTLNTVSRLDFTKVMGQAQAVFYPEEGTDVERVAMAYHAIRNHPSYKVDMGGTATAEYFVTNGNKPAVGAPYQEPCIDDDGDRIVGDASGDDDDFFGDREDDPDTPDDDEGKTFHGSSIFTAANPRIYKGVNIQYDAVLNKVGYHYPQQRIISLWQDAVPIITKQKPGEPFVMRNNTFDCAIYHHSNLVPENYELDDYQVRTPTDIIGQHIHLPKWDLTTADGSANGWNYEDGTLSPGAVRERIEALNHFVHAAPGNEHRAGTGAPLTVIPAADLEALPHPYFSTVAPPALDNQWMGARTTTQRWFFDPVVNTEGVDRGLGIIFTHDHYGPSTHQQIGLYATVLAEPAGSKWYHNETGEQLGQDPVTGAQQAGRIDGGPTSWQAAIVPPAGSPVEPFREFYFEYTDFQHAYEAGVYVGADQFGAPIGGPVGDNAALMAVANAGNPQFNGLAADAFRFSINPPGRAAILPAFPDLYEEVPGGILPGCPARPCPTAIDVQDPGMFAVNYRNEPIALRVFDPNKLGPDGLPGTQAGGPNTLGVSVNPLAGDLAYVLQSRNDRAIPEMNRQPQAGDAIFGTVFPPPINAGGVANGDPFTPMMRTYAGDMIRVKMQAGGDEEEHNATIHGMKWLQTGSGHGKGPNSGWRNAQAGGISEQFTLAIPITPAVNGTGGSADYAYSMDASQDGWWTGMWGILRAYNQNGAQNLFKLPNHIVPVNLANRNNFNGVCPKFVLDANGDVFDPPGPAKNIPVPVRQYDITAVLANDVLDQPVDGGGVSTVTITDVDPLGHLGVPPDPLGGTLVYNPRTDRVAGNIIPVEGAPPVAVEHFGPIHDPTAILYVRTSDLDPVTGMLFAGVKVEPLVIRAAAGECIEVMLRNRLFDPAVLAADNVTPVIEAGGGPVFFDKGQDLFVDLNGNGIGELAACPDGNAPVDDGTGTGTLVCSDGTAPFTEQVLAAAVNFDSMPDLPTYASLIGVNKRDRGVNAAGNPVIDPVTGLPVGATTFQTNLILPSGYVGLHPQLVAYDITNDDGVLVGNNQPGLELVPPGGQVTHRWYAGDLKVKRTQQGNRTVVRQVATAVEFGGSNLQPADKMKQGMKSMVGQLVIEPAGSFWSEDADDDGGRQTATVTKTDGSTFRDFSVVLTKGQTQYYADSSPVEHMNGEGVSGIPEDSQEGSGMAINYGIEPAWFRLGILPNAPFGNDLTPDSFGAQQQFDLYSNALLHPPGSPDAGAIGDPATPVFLATAGQPFRMRLSVPHGTNRGTTFQLHGHVWQRDPYTCPGVKDDLPGRCATEDVGSQAIGDNPLAFHQGAQESINAPTHFDLVLPSAGGGNERTGDYLFRDTASFGNASGLWGILRVQ